MSCSKENPKNPHCIACRIKDVVSSGQSGTLLIPHEKQSLVNWKTVRGDAWLSIPRTQIAHCGKGIEIQEG